MLALGALVIFCATIALIVIALRDPTHYLFLIVFSLIALFPLVAGNLLLSGNIQDFYVGSLVFGLHGHALFAVVALAALPTAQNVYNFAARYERGIPIARDTVLLTTLLAVPALLLIAALLAP